MPPWNLQNGTGTKHIFIGHEELYGISCRKEQENKGVKSYFREGSQQNLTDKESFKLRPKI